MEKEKLKEKHRLEKIVRRIDRDVDSVIVEGWSDKKVLQNLGFTGKIFLSAERTVEDLVEDVERGGERTAILTDFDEHGKEQNRKIRQELQLKVDVISSARKEFGARLTSGGRHALEEAAPLLKSREQRFIEAALDRLIPESREG